MLNPIPRYAPFSNGKYDVAPGLRVFGTDFGNQDQDRHVFQLDRDFERYRKNKVECRDEKLSKYFCRSELSTPVESEVSRFIGEKLLADHPRAFEREFLREGAFRVHCRATGDTLDFDSASLLTSSQSSAKTKYESALDAWAMQMQEDIAVWRLDRETGREWLSAIHLCSPNHWAADDKIGKSFTSVHEPVAGFEKTAKTSPALVEAMVSKGPYVRFAWGVATDQRLNHHPHPPRQSNASEWMGRSFDASKPELHVRVERQTLFGFPALGAALFTIRTSFIDVSELKNNSEETAALAKAIRTMTPESLKYKGLDQTREDVLKWLES